MHLEATYPKAEAGTTRCQLRQNRGMHPTDINVGYVASLMLVMVNIIHHDFLFVLLYVIKIHGNGRF